MTGPFRLAERSGNSAHVTLKSKTDARVNTVETADTDIAAYGDVVGRHLERLGTGHGQRLDSGATYTHFERATEAPDEVVRIYYDSRKNLVARGIIPRSRDRYAWQQPDPFPNGFVPDP